MVDRYVIVSTDHTDKAIIDGPILWDGVQPVQLPIGQELMQEPVALGSGYLYPTPAPAVLNAGALRGRAITALSANIAYLAIAAPTNAQVSAQVKLLTRECSALIRLTLSLLDSTDGT